MRSPSVERRPREVVRYGSRFILALTLSGLASCSSGTGPHEMFEGTYELSSVANHPVPTVIDSSAAGVIEVLGATLVLADHQFVETFRMRTSDGPSSYSLEGSWTVRGAAVHLVSADGTYEHTLARRGDVLETTTRRQDPGLAILRIYVYERRR